MEYTNRIYLDVGSYTGDTVKLFRDKFPEGNAFEIHCFEPNPAFADCYKDLGVNFYPFAAWTKDMEKDFYLCDNKVGSSLMPSKSKTGMDFDNPIKVQAIDFSEWLRKNIPEGSFVVLKMDIEGAEYSVIPKMIEDGTIKLINRLYIDWHVKRMHGISAEVHHGLISTLVGMGLTPKTMCGETGIMK